MTSGENPNATSSDTLVTANYHEIWVAAWHATPPKEYYHSIMIHCPVPLDYMALDLDRIVISQNKSCDMSSGISLPIERFEDDEKKDFCVCVKPLDFPHEPRLARRLIEWIESIVLLGAQKIVIYLYSGM